MTGRIMRAPRTVFFSLSVSFARRGTRSLLCRFMVPPSARKGALERHLGTVQRPWVSVNDGTARSCTGACKDLACLKNEGTLMPQQAIATELHAPVKLSVRAIQLTDEQFAQLCRENPELQLELTAKQELVIMPPTGSETGRCSGEVFYALIAWAKQDGMGISFDSSTGFTLPNGAIRSPDASWVKREKWEALT